MSDLLGMIESRRILASQIEANLILSADLLVCGFPELWEAFFGWVATMPIDALTASSAILAVIREDKPLPFVIEPRAKIVLVGEVLHPLQRDPFPKIPIVGVAEAKRQLEAAAAEIGKRQNGAARPVYPWEKLDDGAIDG